MSLGSTLTISSFGSNIPKDGTLYGYRPIALEGYFSVPIFKNAKRNQLAFYTQPSAVMALLKRNWPNPSALRQAPESNSVSHYKVGWEIGLNAGFLHQILLLEDFMIFYGMASGPHYFPIENDDWQAATFAFANHVSIGFKSRIALPDGRKNFEFSFLARYRHVSNANLFSPNRGLDNIMLGIGMAYLLERKK